MPHPIEDMTPRQIVAELDKYIVGQDDAKRAVAIALRNRYRRQQLPEEDRQDVVPKNILMIGPTGVGKTEIARRLAQLAKAPFVKIEATKFTEVGYVGRDVESMVRDLVSNAVRLVETEWVAEVGPVATEAALDRVVDMLDDSPRPVESFFPTVGWEEPDVARPSAQPTIETDDERQARRARLRQEILDGAHDEKEVDVEVEEGNGNQFLQVFTPGGMEEMGLDMGHLMGGRTRTGWRKCKVPEALVVLQETEANRRMDRAVVNREALDRAEQTGIIFLDEIDKVAMPSHGSGPDVSREGVQRDLLPIIEGSVVPSKFGPVRTDHILFIAAGAFHESKPSDLIPELQGRLPIRVELHPLAESDFVRILTEPKNALTKQYEMLLAVDGVQVRFERDALVEIAHLARMVNEITENIGARRLHTMLERLLEDYLYDAPDVVSGEVVVTKAFVEEQLGNLVKDAEAGRRLV